MDIYKNFAQDFDRTRNLMWPGVVLFLNQLERYSIVADIGCGNGKYLDARPDIYIMGLDYCKELAEIAKVKHQDRDVLRGSAIELPICSYICDAAISIAVLHHMMTIEARVTFVKELLRVVKPGGQGYLTVWAAEAPIKNKHKWSCVLGGHNDYMVPWNSRQDGVVYMRYYHLFTKDELSDLFELCGITKYLITFESDNWHATLYKDHTI